MAWHIFKKDWLLLWPLALAVIFAQFALAGALLALGPLGKPVEISQPIMLFSRLFPLGIALAIAVAVHQDAISSIRQDWLTRPIKRLDLILAKLLFVCVVVQLPMLTTDIIAAVSNGFAAKESVYSAISRNLYALIAWNAPVLAFAALTKNLGQFIAVGIAYFVGTAAATMLFNSPLLNDGMALSTNPLAWTGLAWIHKAASTLILFFGCVAVLLSQYFFRATRRSAALCVTVSIASVVTIFFPWRTTFALEQALSPAPGAARAVAFEIDPKLGRFRPPPGQDIDEYGSFVSGVGAAQVLLRGRQGGDIIVENQRRHAAGIVTIFIPLRLDSVPAQSVVKADRVEVTMTDSDGQIVYHRPGNDFEVRNEGSDRGVTTYQGVRVPGDLFDRIKDHPLNLELSYSLTLLSQSPAVAISAWVATKWRRGWGAARLRSTPRVGGCSCFVLCRGKPPLVYRPRSKTAIAWQKMPM